MKNGQFILSLQNVTPSTSHYFYQIQIRPKIEFCWFHICAGDNSVFTLQPLTLFKTGYAILWSKTDSPLGGGFPHSYTVSFSTELNHHRSLCFQKCNKKVTLRELISNNCHYTEQTTLSGLLLPRPSQPLQFNEHPLSNQVLRLIFISCQHHFHSYHTSHSAFSF